MEPAITGGPGPIISRVHTDHLPHRHLNNGLGPLVDRVHGNQLPYGHILPEIPERNDPEILDSSTVIISPEKQEERPGPLPGGLTWHQWKKMQETACSNGGPCRGIESIRYAWHHLRNLKRHQVSRMPRPTDTPLSVGGFLHSCTFVEIAIFVVVMSTFIAVYGFAVDWPTSKTPHFMPLMVWIGMGVVCTVVVGGTLGIPTATMWGTGYVMELIFSVENVFCFHIVMQAFKTPVRLEQKLLVLCIIFQVVFQAIIFCGLCTSWPPSGLFHTSWAHGCCTLEHRQPSPTTLRTSISEKVGCSRPSSFTWDQGFHHTFLRMDACSKRTMARWS